MHQIPSERDFCLYATRHSHNPRAAGPSSTFVICFPSSGCPFVAELSLITIAAASAAQVRIPVRSAEAAPLEYNCNESVRQAPAMVAGHQLSGSCGCGRCHRELWCPESAHYGCAYSCVLFSTVA